MGLRRAGSQSDDLFEALNGFGITPIFVLLETSVKERARSVLGLSETRDAGSSGTCQEKNQNQKTSAPSSHLALPLIYYAVMVSVGLRPNICPIRR